MELKNQVIGYEELYEVSENGIITSKRRNGTKGISCKPHQIRGYLNCWLSKDGKVKRMSVHRVVAMAFIPNPNNLPQVNHIDGNKLNNHISNLEWCTREYNDRHRRIYLGKDDKGERNGNYGYRHSKLYPSQQLRNKLCELGLPRNKHNLAELGEILPTYIHISKTDYHWLVMFPGILHTERSKNLAEALGKMLAYLIENKLITI